jgi:hypothetical protein
MKHTSRCSPMMRRPCGTLSSVLALSRKFGKSWSWSTRYLPTYCRIRQHLLSAPPPLYSRARTAGVELSWVRQRTPSLQSSQPLFRSAGGTDSSAGALALSSRGTIAKASFVTVSHQDSRASNLPARALQNLERRQCLGASSTLVHRQSYTWSRSMMNQQQAVRACAAAQGACRNDYGCYPRSSAEGLTANHARFGAADSRACMHAPRMTQGADV